mgnify:CR=1 FL=1
MGEMIKSAADNAYECDDTPSRSVSNDYSVSTDGATPKINTAHEDDGSVPMSGQSALPSVKTVSLPDSDETRINSAV